MLVRKNGLRGVKGRENRHPMRRFLWIPPLSITGSGMTAAGLSPTASSEIPKRLCPPYKIPVINSEDLHPIEYQCIVEALQEAQGSITAAARLLGVKRPRLSQMIKEHDITLKQRLRSMP